MKISEVTDVYQLKIVHIPPTNTFQREHLLAIILFGGALNCDFHLAVASMFPSKFRSCIVPIA